MSDMCKIAIIDFNYLENKIHKKTVIIDKAHANIAQNINNFLYFSVYTTTPLLLLTTTFS